MTDRFQIKLPLVETFLPILMIAGVVAVVVGSICIAALLDRKRTAAMRLAAEELGLQFVATTVALPSPLNELPLFVLGRAHQRANAIYAKADETEVTILDYQYTIGHGKSRRNVKQTVACFSSSALSLPRFLLRPELWTDKIAAAFGKQDIDFEEYPLFSKMFLLRGADEPAIRQLFSEEVIADFQRQLGVSVEGGGRALIYFRAGKRVAPRDLRTFLEEAYRVFALFRSPE